MKCGVPQTKPTKEGLWIRGIGKDWACYVYKYGGNGEKEILSYPVAYYLHTKMLLGIKDLHTIARDVKNWKLVRMDVDRS